MFEWQIIVKFSTYYFFGFLGSYNTTIINSIQRRWRKAGRQETTMEGLKMEAEEGMRRKSNVLSWRVSHMI